MMTLMAIPKDEAVAAVRMESMAYNKVTGKMLEASNVDLSAFMWLDATVLAAFEAGQAFEFVRVLNMSDDQLAKIRANLGIVRD